MNKPLTAQHSEWLSLVEVSGPFLTLPVLKRALPMGLDPTPLPLVDDLRVAWKEVGDDESLTPRWIRWVLSDLLELPDEVLKEGTAIGPAFTYTVPEHSVRLRPDFIVVDPDASSDAPARLLVTLLPAGTELDERLPDSKWSADAVDRMAELCRGARVRLGLVTNGDQWALVDAPLAGPTGVATWDANLWLEERITLDAFTTLLGVRRFFSVAPEDTLEAMLAESANAEAEVTDQLGKQVRQAVELLVDAMSRANRDRGGHLFYDLTAEQVYEAAVTVMMRLVFLLSAEERGLFLLGDETYDSTYAVSTLRGQLQEEANTYGEEVIARRTDAWHRLLATFRMVYGGAQHENLRLPAYGGSLFDPDRFPILEGRKADESWRSSPSHPLPIDNRTVLHILGALQVLTFKDRRGVKEARRLSFRALDVEQIGHVYEGLLDHSAVRVDEVAVGLAGKKEPEVALALVEAEAEKGRDPLVEYLADLTGLSARAVEKALDDEPGPIDLERLTSACDNDRGLADRVAPYLGLLRLDLAELPTVYLPDSMYVTQSSDRRSSGTYYTPKVLAEEMVFHALEPLVYEPGPAEGVEPRPENLKSSVRLLDLKICDMAMGSGAFLVAACRFLSARLLEAWTREGRLASDPVPLPGGGSTPMPLEEPDREILARRLVADSCLYGVDRNPMAVEMAKLSLWLITLAKGRPFTFVDHALRCGDSLLGITDIRQLDCFHMDPMAGRELHGGSLFDPGALISPIVHDALDIRRQLESFPILDVDDSDRKQRLLSQASALLNELAVVGDVIVGAALSTSGSSAQPYEARVLSVATEVVQALDRGRTSSDREQRLADLEMRAQYWLDADRPMGVPDRQCLHWPLEFPEVFMRGKDAEGGFDAIVGNPPFIGNKYWPSRVGKNFQGYAKWFLGPRVGKPDLVALFIRQAARLLAKGGGLGLISTQSIVEGESRKVALEPLLDEGTIRRADRAEPWPGAGSVTISKIWYSKAEWKSPVVLDGSVVEAIGSDLRAVSDVMGEAYTLAGEIWGFKGNDNSKGLALVLRESDPWFVRLESSKSPYLRRYITGDDITTHGLRGERRFVIDAGGDSLDAIRDASPATYDFLMQVVMPTRTPDELRSYRGLADRWWQHWMPRQDLYPRVRQHACALVIPVVSKYVVVVAAPSEWCYTNKVCVLEDSRPDLLTILSSASFESWVRARSSSMGSGLSVSLAEAVLSFPLPEGASRSDLGRSLRDQMDAIGESAGVGFTGIMNRIHDEDDSDALVKALRSIMLQTEEDLFASYSWDDIEPEFDFVETPMGVRFTLVPEVAKAVGERLLRLNHERYEREKSLGLKRQGKNAAEKAARSRRQKAAQLDMGEL